MTPIFEIQTFHRVYDIEAPDRATAQAIHRRRYPNEVGIDCKDKTAKRAQGDRKRKGTSDPHAPSNIAKASKRLGPDLQKAPPKVERVE